MNSAAGHGIAADDTTYNFFPHNECYSILMLRVFPAVPDLVYIIGLEAQRSLHEVS